MGGCCMREWHRREENSKKNPSNAFSKWFFLAWILAQTLSWQDALNGNNGHFKLDFRHFRFQTNARSCRVIIFRNENKLIKSVFHFTFFFSELIRESAWRMRLFYLWKIFGWKFLLVGEISLLVLDFLFGNFGSGLHFDKISSILSRN